MKIASVNTPITSGKPKANLRVRTQNTGKLPANWQRLKTTRHRLRLVRYWVSPTPPTVKAIKLKRAKTETAAVKKQHKQTARQNPRRAKPKIRHLRNWPTPKKPLARRMPVLLPAL